MRHKCKGREWAVEVFDDDTDEPILAPRIIKARTGRDAGEVIHGWLESEGFDFTWRIEVEAYDD